MSRATLPALLGLACACASTPAKPPVPRLSEFRLPAQTSIDLMLRNTVDLNLTTPQVAELVKLQAELNQKVKPIQQELYAVRAGRPPPPGDPGPQAAAPPPPPPDLPPPVAPPMSPYPPSGPSRWIGAARESGDLGVPRGPRPREVKEPLPPDYPTRRARLEALIKQYDTEDQAAYARAEATLDESQKATARKLMAERAAERARPSQ